MKTERKNYVLTGNVSKGYTIHEKNHIEAFIANDVPHGMADFLKDHANSGMPALTEREWRTIFYALSKAEVLVEVHGTDIAQLAENIHNSLDETYPKELETLSAKESTESVEDEEVHVVKEQTVPTYFGALEVGDEFYDLKENHFMALKCLATVDFMQHNCVCIGNGDLKGQVRFKKDDQYVLKIIT